jgi:epoxyqueuosine reductase QueG
VDIKSVIKETALKNGMDLCGVASVDRFDESPPGRHPTDILPGCKSVIVVGVRLLDGVVQANFRTYENGRHDLKGLYGTYGYTMLPNFELTYACYAVAQAIERNLGETATPLSTGPMTNGAQISIRHCAVAAGLGEFGWMSIVLTPEFGPRNRFGVILTTAELEPDPMRAPNQLCDPKRCRICVDVCPTKAIGAYGSEDTLTCTLGDTTYQYGKINVPRCQVPTQGLRKEFGGREDWVTTDDPTDKDIAEANAKVPVSAAGLQHMESWHCGLCLSYCPVGKWKERFLDKELTGGAAGLTK